MIGIIIGAVFSVVILTIFSKDTKAVNQHKKKQQSQQAQKLKVIKAQRQRIEKLKNDPILIQKKQESQNRMKEKLYKGLSKQDRQLIESYMDEQKNSGKSDDQIIKDTTAKAGLVMLVMMVLVFVMVAAIIVITTGSDFSQFRKEITKFATFLYPKFATNSAQTGGSSQL